MTETKGTFPMAKKDERGMAFMIALLAVIVLMLMGTVFLTVSLTESTITSNAVDSSKAFGIAEAGVALARRQLASSPWHAAFNNLVLPGLVKEYSTALNTADANVADWSTTVPNPLSDATRIRWRGLSLNGGTYTVTGASVDENGVDLDLDQVRILAIGYVPNSTAPKTVRSIEALLFEPANFLEYGFSSTGAVFSDAITFATQPGGKNESYNGGPGVFKPSLDTGYYSGGNIPSGGMWSSTESLSSPLTYPPIDFGRYAAAAASSPTVVDLTPFKDPVTGVVNITSAAQITDNTVYYVDGSIFVANIGANRTASFIATHDLKLNPGQGLTAVSGYPLFMAGGYIYMDTDNTTPLRGAFYSDGSHALAADRTYPIDPTWVGHGPLGTAAATDLVYIESASQIIGTVAARIPPGSGLRLFGGGGSTITYDMNLLDGLANLYVDESAPAGRKYISWREK